MSSVKPAPRYQNMLQTVLAISTGHLTARTAQFLRDHDAADWPTPGGHFGDMGWFFWVDEGAGANIPHLPYDLMSAFEYAAGMGAVFVIFQDVSPVVPQLPTYSESGRFVADTFLNRPQSTIDELDDDAAVTALKALSLEPDFVPTPTYLAARMTSITNEIATLASNRQVSALPHNCLTELSDLVVSYHFHTRLKTIGFDAGVPIIEDLAAKIDVILADRDLALLAKHRRTREILEDVKYRLALIDHLLQVEPTRR